MPEQPSHPEIPEARRPPETSGSASELARELLAEQSVSEILESTDPTLDDIMSVETIGYRNSLRSLGGAAATTVLERIHQLPAGHPDRVLLPELLTFCATSDQAEAIGRLLEIEDTDRTQVLEVLKYVGTSANVPQIRSLMEGLQTEPPNEYADEQVDSAIYALAAIRHRTTAEPELNQVDALLDIAVTKAVRHGVDQMADLREDALLYTQPETLTRLRESMFARYDYDADYYNDTDYSDNEDYYASLQAAPDDLPRVEVIRNLVSMGAIPIAGEQPTARTEHVLSRLEYQEAHPSPYAPTLGIEIEIYAPTLLPRQAADWSGVEEGQYLMELDRRFIQSRTAGVPKGGDGYWEFANNPVRGYETLGREVQALANLNLINTEHKRHPMHLTIGGITTEGPKGRDVYLLTRTLEATGWSTTGGRIMKPVLLQKPSWLHKGEEGVKERESGDIQLGSAVAVEIRTLQFQGLSGLERTLSSAYGLGAALRAYQSEPHDRDENQNQLAAIWSDFSHKAGELFGAYGMKDPVAEPWTSRILAMEESPDAGFDSTKKFDLDGSYKRLAGLLNEAAKDKNSEGAVFVDQMQDLVIGVRSGARQILAASQKKEQA